MSTEEELLAKRGRRILRGVLSVLIAAQLINFAISTLITQSICNNHFLGLVISMTILLALWNGSRWAVLVFAFFASTDGAILMVAGILLKNLAIAALGVPLLASGLFIYLSKSIAAFTREQASQKKKSSDDMTPNSRQDAEKLRDEIREALSSEDFADREWAKESLGLLPEDLADEVRKYDGYSE
ncbi:hypothetical protein KAI87_06475 [Myxococcota bacterium]|nr:hypothetical protein [Myxococcota bacterium]